MPREIDFVIDVSEPSYGVLPNLPHPDSIQFIGWIGDSTKIEDEFYRVSNVHIGYDGLIYVKHFNTNSIRVYNSMGEFKYSIGRGGRGPGEFTQLGTFKLDENSQTLYAIDEHSFKIEVFSKVHDRFVYLRSIFHNFNSAHDLCLLGNELIVSGSSLPTSLQNGRLQNSSPIARINPLSGEIIATFGFVCRILSNGGSLPIKNQVWFDDEVEDGEVGIGLLPYLLNACSFVSVKAIPALGFLIIKSAIKFNLSFSILSLSCSN
jgi:hypothetical protein